MQPSSEGRNLGLKEWRRMLVEGRSTRNAMSWRLIAGVLGSHFQGQASPHFRPNLEVQPPLESLPALVLALGCPGCPALSALLCPTIV